MKKIYVNLKIENCFYFPQRQHLIAIVKRSLLNVSVRNMIGSDTIKGLICSWPDIARN